FNHLAEGRRLVSLFSFENEELVFPGVHHSYRFALLTLGANVDDTEFAFFLRQVDGLQDTRRRFTLSASEIAAINHNSKTAPVFRTKTDADLTATIYKRVPVLIEESTSQGNGQGNPWRMTYRQGLFNMTSDSNLFHDAAQVSRVTEVMLPLYEAKMIHQFDHRWATYVDDDESRDATISEKQDPCFSPQPRYWVKETDVNARLADKGWTRDWLIGWRDVTSAHVFRSMIACAFPRSAVG